MPLTKKKKHSHGLSLLGLEPAVKKSKLRSPRQIEIATRRAKVFNYKLRGMRREQMARLLNVGIPVIKKDLEWISKNNKEMVKNHDQDSFIGMALQVFGEVGRRAWTDYLSSDKGSIARVRFLDLIRSTYKDQVGLLFDVGLLTKKSSELAPIDEGAGEINRDITSSMKKAIARALLEDHISTAKKTLHVNKEDYDKNRGFSDDDEEEK